MGSEDILLLYQRSGPMSVIYYVEEILYKGRSKYQDIMIAKLRHFGKALILDDLIQSTEYDEHIYHEALVHPAMVLHPCPRRVLVLGGGEGATLREVLRHHTVEKAVMVDIDEKVVELAKKHLKEWHQGALEDKRAEVHIMDGRRYVEEAAARGEKFDVVIMDLVDPYGPEIASALYTPEAFKLIKSVLSGDGVLVTQAGCSTLFPEAFQRVMNAAKSVFRYASEYMVWVPSFAYNNSFVIASDSYDPDSLSVEEVDKRLRERGVSTRFFNGRRYKAMLWMA